MKTVTVAAFNSLAEAEPLKQRLVAAGIAAEVRSEAKLEETMNFSRVSAGFRIQVPRKDFETALRLVYDWDAVQKSRADLPDQPEFPGRQPATYPLGESSPPGA